MCFFGAFFLIVAVQITCFKPILRFLAVFWLHLGAFMMPLRP